MEERELNQDEFETLGSLYSRVHELPKEFWEELKTIILANTKVSEEFKDDCLMVLDVVNQLYNKKGTLAFRLFEELTEQQKNLLFQFLDSGALKYRKLGKQYAGIFSDFFKKTDQEVSYKASGENENLEGRTYQVSEDRFHDLLFDLRRGQFLIGKLEAAIEILDEDDPRWDFAAELLKDYYRNNPR